MYVRNIYIIKLNNMKIAIGLNIYKQNPTQDLAIECLKKIKNKNKNVEIYNIGYEEEFVEIPEFKSLPILQQSSIELTKNTQKKKPISNEFFDILSNQESDYFLFMNSDILLSQKVINLISKHEYDSYIFSICEINDIKTIEDAIVPYKMEVAGFDAWCVRNEWWKKNSCNIPKCIYSEVAWDNIFMMSLFTNSNSKLCNKEFYIGHITHDMKWSRESPEGQYNMKTWLQMPISNNWDYYMQTVLFNRHPFGSYLQPLTNEEELEKQILKR